MKTKVLGNSDLYVTPVGFGAWAIGGDWEFGWGAQDDAQSVAAIHRALELGVNWIDTAAVYGLGHSEEVVARALQEWEGPRPYVFTKCGMIWNAQGKVDYSVGMEYRRQQGVNGQGNSLGFFFSVPLPVFSRNQGEIARVQTEEQQLRKQLEALQAQVGSEVVGAYREYETSRELITEIERDLLAPSQEARDTTAYVYRAGASSLVDVLDAQRAFNETMSAYYGAQADYRRAVSKLESVVGQEVSP